jgi:hypothetical protein
MSDHFISHLVTPKPCIMLSFPFKLTGDKKRENEEVPVVENVKLQV